MKVNIEDRFFETSDHVKLHYTVCGQGDPLVILPGYSGTARSFEGNFDAFAAHFTVYTLEYRAHGQSQVPVSGFHTERLAMDFKEFLDAEGIDRCCLLAHSMGNAVAWCYFELFGQDRVDRYVLAEEGPTFMDDPAWTEEERAIHRGVMVWDMHLNAKMKARLAVPREGESAAQGLARAEAMAGIWKDHIANDWSDVIPQIKVKTLIVMGDQSHFAAEPLWRFMHESIEGSRLEVIRGAGHMVYTEAADTFNSLALDFLLH